MSLDPFFFEINTTQCCALGPEGMLSWEKVTQLGGNVDVCSFSFPLPGLIFLPQFHSDFCEHSRARTHTHTRTHNWSTGWILEPDISYRPLDMVTMAWAVGQPRTSLRECAWSRQKDITVESGWSMSCGRVMVPFRHGQGLGTACRTAGT